MATIDQTAASRAVLIEAANVLGAFRDELVIVGGWVPELLFPGQGHVGSLDVDFAVSPKAVSNNAYETIRKRLVDAGYRLHLNPTHFTKDVVGATEPVKVDLISGQNVGSAKVQAILVNELCLSCLSGIDLAFLASDEMVITGSMPDGTKNSVCVRIVRPEAFILIKAFALEERTKEKDAYDVAFVLQHYQPSLADLAARVAVLRANRIADRGYAILKTKFETIQTVGPVWVARVAQGQGLDYDQSLQAAFQDAQELFRLVGS